MAAQNLISTTLTDEQKASINQKIEGLKTDLGFATSIPGEEKKDYVRIGSSMLPLLDLAHDTVTAHPEILPGVFDKAEFQKDYQLSKDLFSIVAQLDEILESVRNTMFAATSDCMVETLEVYAAVQQHKDKVTGLEATADGMKAYFKKRSKPQNPPVQG